MTNYVSFGDIVENNGKTIRENNLEQTHNIPVGALVEVQYTNWFGDGACEKVHARLWVVKQGRDCDGTPLYWLSKEHPDKQREKVLLYWPDEGIAFKEDVSRSIIDNVQGGFSEESLKVIEITERLRKGYDALKWPEKSENDVEGAPV